MITTRISALLTGVLVFTSFGCSESSSPPTIVEPIDTTLVNAVARVAISASSAVAEIGKSVQLSAEAFSPTDAKLAVPVTWTSLDQAIATVDANGVVRGVSSGFARIVASAGTRSDTARVAVPAAMASCVAPTISQHGFDDGSEGPFNNNGYTLTSDATARGGWSATKTWQRTGTETYSAVEATFPGTQRVHARWRYKQSADFDNSGIKKMLFTKGPNFGIGTGLLVIYHNRFAWYYDRLGDAQTNFFPNVGQEITPNELRGDWHWYELVNDISTSGALRVRFWIDGVLVMDHTDQRSNQGATIGTLMFNGTFNTPSGNGTDWLDELAVSTSCIGLPD